jgi:hypothetical protein
MQLTVCLESLLLKWQQRTIRQMNESTSVFGAHLEAVTWGRWLLASEKDCTTFVPSSCIATKLADCLPAGGNCLALDS